MGYYLRSSGTLTIPSQNVNEAFNLLCDLNKPSNNYLKIGGSFSKGVKNTYWFSWMPEKYDETCEDLSEILHHLGFNCKISENGNYHVNGFDGKMGQEELFFKTIQHLVYGTMNWTGEDGYRWAWSFENDQMNVTELQLAD